MIEIKYYIHNQIDYLIELQQKYIIDHPEYEIRGAKVYNEHPIFDGGKNILCAFDACGNMIAYLPMAPVPVEDSAPSHDIHRIWADLIYDSSVKDIDLAKKMLVESAIRRVKEISSIWPKRDVRLIFQKFSNDMENIEFFKREGFNHYESTYLMVKDLEKIDEIKIDERIEIMAWDIDSADKKANYLKLDNEIFTNSPMSSEDFDWNLKNQWSKGSPIGAFDMDGNLIGNVMAFKLKEDKGITEEVFVCEDWRKKGVAKAMLTEAFKYLKNSGMMTAELHVTTSNSGALKVYKDLGYVVKTEECSLGRIIDK